MTKRVNSTFTEKDRANFKNLLKDLAKDFINKELEKDN